MGLTLIYNHYSQLIVKKPKLNLKLKFFLCQKSKTETTNGTQTRSTKELSVILHTFHIIYFFHLLTFSIIKYTISLASLLNFNLLFLSKTKGDCV